MTITQIKEKLNLKALDLNTSEDGKGNKTDWMRAWDNENRVAVSIHKELVAEIKADATIASLGLQTETRQGEKGDYTAHRIVKYAPAEVSL